MGGYLRLRCRVDASLSETCSPLNGSAYCLLPPVSMFQSAPCRQAETKTSKTPLLGSKTAILINSPSMPPFSFSTKTGQGIYYQHDAAPPIVLSFLFDLTALPLLALASFPFPCVTLSSWLKALSNFKKKPVLDRQLLVATKLSPGRLPRICLCRQQEKQIGF